MTADDIRDAVRRTVESSWSDFAQRHPKLAAVMDQELLISGATASLADDPAFRKALRRADAAAKIGDSITSFIQDYVKGWIGKLVK